MQRVTRSQHTKKEKRRARRRNQLARQALKKGARNEHDGKQSAVIDFETFAYLHRNAERTAEGHGRQLVEHQFCAAGTVDREACAGAKTRSTAC